MFLRSGQKFLSVYQINLVTVKTKEYLTDMIKVGQDIVCLLFVMIANEEIEDRHFYLVEVLTQYFCYFITSLLKFKFSINK